MVGWALCCEALSSRAFKELLALAGYYLPWHAADLLAFDDLLRSYRQLEPGRPGGRARRACCGTSWASRRRSQSTETSYGQSSSPQAETTAANLARVLRLHTLPSTPWEPRQRAAAARRLLEELGVHCDETAALHDLKGFLLSSPRGTEMVVSRDLDDEQRLEVYAHLIAHALLGPDGPGAGAGGPFRVRARTRARRAAGQ